MDEGTPVLVERPAPGVALVRFNRPEKRNAFNHALSAAVIRALDELEHDDDVRCVILTGAGKAFSAGADMTEALDSIEGGGRGDGMAQAVLGVGRFPKPVIAAVNGPAFGGGAALAIACDIRIASPAASFRFPGAVYGLVVGGSQLPRLIGPARAKEILFTARVVEAAEAERIGLVNRITPAERLVPECIEMAALIASHSPGAVVWTKRVVDRATEVDAGIEAEIEANQRLRGSRDHVERFREATKRVTEGQ
jgi:enoyl-CoA hydratase/carnithine racemase